MFGARLIIDGLYFLVFNIIWYMCYTFLKVQSYISQLYSDPMPIARKGQSILEAHRMYYKLIHMINEFCEVFKYPLGSFLFHLLCVTCLHGYSYCRLMVGHPLAITTPVIEWLVTFLSVSYLVELYILSLVTNMVGRLHADTFHILRSFCGSDLEPLVQRSVSSYTSILLYYPNFSIIYHFRMTG